MIEKLNWDSDFFGYPVGKINANEGIDLLLSDEININQFRLIYIFSDHKLIIKDKRVSEVDIKTTLIRTMLKNEELIIHPAISEYDGSQDEALHSLAIESGVYSRFKRDPGFKDNEFFKLYSKWIRDSIDKKIADKLLVYMEDNKIGGFVSLKFKAEYAEIGLIAVHGNSRGKGIAMALLYAAFFHTKKQGFNYTHIVTQFENTPAMKLYQKAGFKIENKKYVYHLWNK